MRNSQISLVLRLLAVVITASSTAVHATVLVDYNTPGSLAGNFALNSGPAGLRFAEVSTGGIGNSGAVDIINALDADNTTAVYSPNSFDLSGPGTSVTVSQFGLRRNGQLTNTPFFQLGVLSDLNERMDNDAAANSYASLILFPISSNVATNIKMQYEYRTDGGSRQRVDTGLTASLITGHWYNFTATFTYDTSSSLLFSGALEDWGTTGTSFVSTVFSLAPTSPAGLTMTGTGQVNGDSSVWAGYRGYQEGGAELYDNFSAAPEPAAMILLGLSAVVIRRRR